ncbi:MAG TPA: winged helix-turn-helix transcriptional regulator, partial [Bacteroidales bacterium]|nr:winged helix-turn-helix transcriptional regulator [Bacteroidales bacterium]
QETNITTQETNNTTQETNNTTQETDNTTQETSKKRPRNVQETTQEIILRIIKENPQITQSELSKTIGLTINGIKYHMKKLTKAGIIKHEGPTKSGKWIILKK